LEAVVLRQEEIILNSAGRIISRTKCLPGNWMPINASRCKGRTATHWL